MTMEEILDYQFPVDDDTANKIRGLIDKSYLANMWEITKAYQYGFIMGKRMERARRKRSKQ